MNKKNINNDEPFVITENSRYKISVSRNPFTKPVCFYQFDVYVYDVLIEIMAEIEFFISDKNEDSFKVLLYGKESMIKEVVAIGSVPPNIEFDKATDVPDAIVAEVLINSNILMGWVCSRLCSDEDDEAI